MSEQAPHTPMKRSIAKRKRDNRSDESGSYEIDAFDDDSEQTATRIAAVREEHRELLQQLQNENARRRKRIITEKEFVEIEFKITRQRLSLLSQELKLGLEPGRVLEKCREIFVSPSQTTKLIGATLNGPKNTTWQMLDNQARNREEKREAKRVKRVGNEGKEKPANSSSMRGDKSGWRRDAWKALGAENGQDRWCCVIGEWLPVGFPTKLAHIVPVSLGKEMVEHFFDVPDGDEAIWDPRNVLPLTASIEQRFDTGQIIIVPVKRDTRDDEKDVYDYQLRILDKSIYKDTAYPKIKFSDLDGKFLEFQSELRPGKRYLFYHFLTSILTAGSRHFVEWEDVLSQIKAWAPTPGYYVRRGLARSMAKQIGRPDFEQTVEAAGLVIEDDGHTLCDDLATTGIIMEKLGKSLQGTLKDDRERDSEDEEYSDRTVYEDDDEDDDSEDDEEQTVVKEVQSLNIHKKG